MGLIDWEGKSGDMSRHVGEHVPICARHARFELRWVGWIKVF